MSIGCLLTYNLYLKLKLQTASFKWMFWWNNYNHFQCKDLIHGPIGTANLYCCFNFQDNYQTSKKNTFFSHSLKLTIAPENRPFAKMKLPRIPSIHFQVRKSWLQGGELQIFIKGLHRGHRGVRTSPFFYRHCAALICNCTKAIPLGSEWRDKWWSFRIFFHMLQKKFLGEICVNWWRNIAHQVYSCIIQAYTNISSWWCLYVHSYSLWVLLGGISSLERREVRTSHVENSEIAALYQNTFLPSQHFEQTKLCYLLAWFPYSRQYESLTLYIKTYIDRFVTSCHKYPHVWVNYNHIINPFTNLDFPDKKKHPPKRNPKQ